MSLKLLTQRIAQTIDERLFSSGGFSVDQLMELAGLSVAQAITRVYDNSKYSRVLVCCGPGNNGGDGLVAARHLFHFGYKPSIFYPKQSKKELYEVIYRVVLSLIRLVIQCQSLKIPITTELSGSSLTSDNDLIVDALFGFSFTGEIRPPFDQIIQKLKGTNLPIVSVDIPSGWDVEKGNTDNHSFTPSMLISLTAPKLCASYFNGIHFLGGRFVPPELEREYELNLPVYPGTDHVVDITNVPNEKL